MTRTSTEQERAEFEAWAQARGLETVRLRSNRPHAGEYFWQQVQDAWCIWKELQAARRDPVVPQGYEHGMLTGNRVILDFDTQENADLWFDKFCDSYDASAPKLLANHASAKR